MRRPQPRRGHTQHFLPLDSRVLLANLVNFTDLDGDEVTVRVTGPGEADITPSLDPGGGIALLTLSNTTEQSVLSISVKAPSGGGGDGRVLLHGLSNATLKSIKAPSTDAVFDAVRTFTGVVSLTIGDIGIDAQFNITPPVGKTLAVVARNVNGGVVVDGSVSSVRLVNMFDTGVFNAQGSIGSIRAEGDLAGRSRADYFGSITADFLSAELTARFPDARGYSWGAIKVGSAQGALLQPDDAEQYGRVRSITTVGDWNDGEIHVLGIDTLRIGDDFRPNVMNLRAQGTGVFALRSATIVDEIAGEWSFGALIGTLKAGRTRSDDFELDMFGSDGHIGAVTFTDPNGTAGGEWEVASIRTLTARGELEGEWDIEGLVPGTLLSIRSISARVIDGMDIDDELPGGIGSITANLIVGVDIFARFFGTITVKPGNGFAGDLLAGEFRAYGDDGSAGAFSLRSLDVRGQSEDSTIMTRSHIRSVTFGRFFDTIVFAGHTDVLDGTHPVFGDISDFDGTKTIGSFTVKGPFDAANSVFGLGVRVTAGTINKITIGGAINPANGGQQHGFFAVFESIKYRDENGDPVTLTAADFVGPFIVALPNVSDDLVFRTFT